MTNENTKNTENKNMQIALSVSAVSIVVNIALSLFKLIAGLAGKSYAMVSDAVHSASDVFSTIVVIIGVKIAGKESDEEHPYGHDRLESACAVILSLVLAVTGIGIGWSGIKKIALGDISTIAIPTMLPLTAAIISIAVKELMYRYTKGAAKKIESDALMADAWHHRSDSLSSIGSMVGIIGARMGYPILDSVASVFICLFILKASYDIFMGSLDKMVDKACDAKTVESMKQTILEDEKIISIDDIKTRLFGAKCYVDIEIGADGNVSLFEAHGLAEGVHDRIEKKFPQVKHCMVHVNPVDVKALEKSE